MAPAGAKTNRRREKGDAMNSKDNRRFSITGMSCAVCAMRIERAVLKVPGVTSCSVSLLTNEMSVTGTASDEEIVAAVVKIGFGAKPIAVQAVPESAPDDTRHSSPVTRHSSPVTRHSSLVTSSSLFPLPSSLNLTFSSFNLLLNPQRSKGPSAMPVGLPSITVSGFIRPQADP